LQRKLPALDAGWIPVRVKKTRPMKKQSLRSDSVGTENALSRHALLFFLT
jgi:hypothetical protein